ncbi:hypothetical protein MTsN2n4_41830 [Pseudoalteromonas sp. MTN2-4]
MLARLAHDHYGTCEIGEAYDCVGLYNLIDNPTPIPEISEARKQKVASVIDDIQQLIRKEEDPQIREGLNLALKKAESKKYPSYSEFLNKFSQEKIIPLKNKIYELTENERRAEQQARKDNPNYTYTGYRPSYGQGLQELQKELQDLEIFQSKYKPDPKGYLQYLKKEFSSSAHGFYLGSIETNISFKYRKKHTYVMAQTGSGKSEFLKVLANYDIINEKRATIVIDPHGDMVEQIAKNQDFAPEAEMEKLVYIDPTAKEGFSPSINPFEIKDLSEKNIATTTQELKRVLKALLQGAGATQQMEAILSPCIAVLLRKKDGCFEDLQRFMDDKNNADLLEMGMNSPNPQHANLFRDKFQSKDYGATKHGIYTRIQILLNDPIFTNLISNKTTLDLENLIEQKKTILFKLSLGEGGSESMEAFGRFIVGMLRIIAIGRAKIDEHKRTPTLLYIDEFQNFVSEDIESALTQLRKYGLHLVLAHQYAGQKIDTGFQKAVFGSGVKVIGKCDVKSAKSAGAEIGVDYEEINNLKVGEFFIKNPEYPAVKMHVPMSMLKLQKAMQMSKEEWEQVKQYSIDTYHAKIVKKKPRIKTSSQASYYANKEESASGAKLKIKPPKYSL